jgi:hypothetical protein
VDRNFILWVPWEIHQLFSTLVSWNSDVLAKMAVITSVPRLFQFTSSRIKFVPQWPVIISDICHISWIQASLSMWLQFTDKEWPKVIFVLSTANLLKVDLNGLNEIMPSQARKTCNML